MLSLVNGRDYLKTYVLSTLEGVYKIYGNTYIIYDLMSPNITLQDYISAPYITINIIIPIDQRSFSWFWSIVNGFSFESGLSLWKTMCLEERLRIWSYFNVFRIGYTTTLFGWYYSHLLENIGTIEEVEMEVVQQIIDFMPEDERKPNMHIINRFDMAYSKLLDIPIYETPGMKGMFIPDVEGSIYIVGDMIFSGDSIEIDDVPEDIDLKLFGKSPLKIRKHINGKFLVQAEGKSYILPDGENVTSVIGIYEPVRFGIFIGSKVIVSQRRSTWVRSEDFLVLYDNCVEMRVGDLTLCGDPLIMAIRSPTIQTIIEEKSPYTFLASTKIDTRALLYVWSYMNGVNLPHPMIDMWDVFFYLNYFQIDLSSRFVEEYLYFSLESYQRGWNESLYNRISHILGSIPLHIRKEYKLLTGDVIGNNLMKIWVPGKKIFNTYYSRYIDVSPQDARVGDVYVVWYLKGIKNIMYVFIRDVENTPLYLNGVRRTMSISNKEGKITLWIDNELVHSVITIISNPTSKSDHFRFHNRTRSRYDDEEKIATSVSFPLDFHQDTEWIITFPSPVTMKAAINAAEDYLNKPFTKEDYGKGIRLETWEEVSTSYKKRGDLLNYLVNLKGVHLKNGGLLVLEISN